MSERQTGESNGAYEAWKRWWRQHIERATVVLKVKRWIRQRMGTEPRSRVEVHCHLTERGGWRFCPDVVREGHLVYGFGVGEDLRLECALATEYGAHVVAFDPTPSSVEWVRQQRLPPGLRHVPVAVGGEDGRLELYEPIAADGSHSFFRRGGQTGRSVTVPVRRLPSIMRELGHERIDHLKLDVEGAEYSVIDDLLAERIHVRQLLVEFHHRFASIGPGETTRTLRKLHGAGYHIAYISPEGQEYAFLGPDPPVVAS